MLTSEAATARRFRFAVIAAVAVLILVLIAWRVMTGFSIADAVLIAALTLPLWIALPRLLAGHRRTFAWLSLAVTPFLIVAITEAVADPASRPWAGLCLLIAFALFVLSIAYLRATREHG